jgi:hypothetical protein
MKVAWVAPLASRSTSRPDSLSKYWPIVLSSVDAGRGELPRS